MTRKSSDRVGFGGGILEVRRISLTGEEKGGFERISQQMSVKRGEEVEGRYS